MSRYNSYINLINAGGYDLATMKDRLYGLADRGELTLEERDNLIKHAEERANPIDGKDKEKMLTDHEARIRALEDKIKALMGEGGETEGGESGTVTLKEPYDPYRWYFTGDGCSFNGKNYTCKDSPASHPCTWAPNVMANRWELDAVQPTE